MTETRGKRGGKKRKEEIVKREKDLRGRHKEGKHERER